MARKTFAKPLKSAHREHKAPKSSPSGKDRALAALLESRSIVAAAQQAAVGESTLRRWLRDDEDFQRQLRQRREQALRHVGLRLQQRASEAVEALFDSIASEKRVEPGRAAMLRTALDFAFRAGSYNDLAERLDTLERIAKQDRENPRPTNSTNNRWPSQLQHDELAPNQEETDLAPAAVNGHDKTRLQ